MSKNLSELSGRKGLDENLFEKLGEAAEKNGTPSVAAIDSLSEEYLFGKANVFGTTTFYDFLKPENKGKKVYLCNGSACMTAGTQDALKKKLKRHFKESEIGEMCCLGRCHENNAFYYNGNNYSGKSADKIYEIKKKKSFTDTYAVSSTGTPVITAPFDDLLSYYTNFTNKVNSAKAVLDEIKFSGLRGRGGAGFPIAIKLESCKNTPSKIKYIVCNADEGDPGAYSDRYIMEQRPHLLLLGMMIAGYVTGASYGVLYIRAEYPESVRAIENALKELQKNKITSEKIFENGFDFKFKIIKAQGAYICGEETALLSSIEGQRPEVRVRPPYPAQQGLFNKPTVVNNVETLAALPWIVYNGGAAYASIGKGKSTGTKLVSLDSAFKKPGIYEVDMGTPLKTVFEKAGGGLKKKIKAFHIGGPLGGLVPLKKVKDLTVDFESFSQNGFLLGHASVVSIPEKFPIIKYIEHLFSFTAHESCGKCFPCRLGSTRGSEMLNKAMSDKKYKIDKTLFSDLLETLEIGSLCALGGGLPLPVKNALHYFDNELKNYFKK